MSFNQRRLNRVRSLGSKPSGIEYSQRQDSTAGFYSNNPAAAQNNSPKIENEKGFTYPFTVTNVSQLLLPADLNRKMLHFVNNDALGNVSVSFGRPQPYGIGLLAAAGGGGALLDNHVPTAAVYIIGNVASNANFNFTVV